MPFACASAMRSDFPFVVLAQQIHASVPSNELIVVEEAIDLSVFMLDFYQNSRGVPAPIFQRTRRPARGILAMVRPLSGDHF